MAFGAARVLRTCGVLALVLAGSEAAACKPARPPAGWDQTLSPRRHLVYEAGSTVMNSASREPTLKLYDVTTVKWSVPWTEMFARPAELSPSGKVIAFWGAFSLKLLSAKDGTTFGSVTLSDLLSQAERFGGQVDPAIQEHGSYNPCGDRGPGEQWSMKHEWKPGGVLKIVVTTAPQADGATTSVELEVNAAGVARRLTAEAPDDLQTRRETYAAAKSEGERRKALTALVWASSLQASLDDHRTEPFFLAVARDKTAPPDFFRLAIKGLGLGKDLFEFVGRDAEVDERLLNDAAGWPAERQAEALSLIVAASKTRTPEQLRLAVTLLTAKMTDLGDLAAELSKSTDPGLRSALLAKLNLLPPSPAHLSAALAFLDERDAQMLELARKVTITNLNRAALKRHVEEILAALEKQKINPWPEGDLAFGAYLQASGQVALAGGMFASGVERTDDKPSPLRNELLSRLALNMMIRGKHAEAKAAVTALQVSGGPLGGPLICALSVPEVRVGLLAPCGRKVPTKVQAEALAQALEAAK